MESVSFLLFFPTWVKAFSLSLFLWCLIEPLFLSEGLGKVKLYFYHLKKRTVKIIPCPSTTTDRLHKSRL